MNFKKMLSKVSSRMIYLKLMSITLLFFVVTSCSKEKDGVDVSNGDKVSLAINIEGVQGPDIASSLRASIDNQIGLRLPEKRNVVTASEDDIFFDVVSEEEYLPSNLSSIKSIKKKLSETDPMGTGIKYRLILFNAATDQFYITAQAKVGEDSHIPVTPGQTYKWIAYSYNSTVDIPPPADRNNPSIVTPTNTTLLYASGTISTTSDGTALPITFKHQLTQLKVEVKEARGIRAILSTAGEFASPDYVKTCSFNLRDGSKGSLTSAGITTLNFASLSKGDTVMQVAQYYTADNNLTSYNVNLSAIDLQYTVSSTRNLTPAQMINSGHISFSFPASPASKRGYILRGELKLSFVLPVMNILAVSDGSTYGYKLDPGSASGSFIRSTYNFGPTSNYVKTKALNVSSQTIVGGDYVKNLLANPANYPDILVIANASGYLSADSWIAVGKYLAANGNVFYTQDGVDIYTSNYLTQYLGGTVTHHLISEGAGVYKFTDTPEAEEDIEILNGPFGDVRPYQWGQDVAGTTYLVYSGTNIIRYSTHSQNYGSPGANHTAFFRHKTDGFFYISDGGFLANPAPGDYGGATSYNIAPFRTKGGTGVDRDFPVVSMYGFQAQANSPTYFPPHQYATVGTYPIVNSMIFGNIMAWMLNRASYIGIVGQVRTP